MDEVLEFNDSGKQQRDLSGFEPHDVNIGSSPNSLISSQNGTSPTLNDNELSPDKWPSDNIGPAGSKVSKSRPLIPFIGDKVSKDLQLDGFANDYMFDFDQNNEQK